MFEGDKTLLEKMSRRYAGRLADLVGKKPRPGDVMQWVANNMSLDPDMESCPGMAAFTLLCDCLEYPQFRVDFWKTMWTRLVPAKTQLTDEVEDGPIDGALTLELLAKIRKIRDDAVNKRKPKEDAE
jgi:hypothetical protein